MAVSIHGLTQATFYRSHHHQRPAAARARTGSPVRFDREISRGHQLSQLTPSMAIQADLQGYRDPTSAFKSSSSGHSQPPSPGSASPLFFSAPPSPFPSHQPQRRHASISPERPPDLARAAPKRRRALHDVDGPHTGSLGCKKRRLRRHLITSRLSRPYSSPATHILNREAAAGAKRFLKMAAAAAAKKLTTIVMPTPPTADWSSGRAVAAAQVATVVPANSIHHLAPAEMVRRAAIMNSFRIRVCDEARQRGDRTDLQLTASAALLRAGPGLHGVGFVTTLKGIGEHADSSTKGQDRATGVTQDRSAATSPPSAAQRSVTMSGASFYPSMQRPGSAVRWPPSSSPDQQARPCGPGRRSPGLSPLGSPELSALRADVDCEGLEDEGELSFPATDYSDDFLENESDEVYTDFGAIFGGGDGRRGDEADDSEGTSEARGSSGEGQGDHDGEHFEDYMDDLDGIPWGAR